MYDILKARLKKAFKLTRDLFSHLEEAALSMKIPNLPSNEIAGQVWCVIGARESYFRAIKAGVWQGFACSLNAPRVKESVMNALNASEEQFDQIDFSSLDPARAELAFALLEHEIQHHGQLIRYVYANRLGFPESWNRRYTV